VSLVGIGLLLTVVVEVVLFVLVAHWLGVGPTILLVLATSLVGAWLLRNAGVRAWRGLRAAGSSGRPPGQELGQGLLGLLSGLLLVLPGFLTDLVGLALLAPPVRRVAGRGVQRVAERRLSSAVAGNVFGPRRVRVRRGQPYRPTPGEPTPAGGPTAPGGAPIEGEIVER
jgi:UPF0716 protein FxsA